MNAALTGNVRSMPVAGSISSPMYSALISRSAFSNASSAAGERCQITSVSSVARIDP